MSAQSSINRIESDLQTVLQKRSTRTRPWKLIDRDVKDVGKVLAKLKDPANPAAVHLLNKFSPANRAKINGFTASSESMVEARLVLASEFNSQIDDAKSDLLTADFSKVKLRDSTRDLQAKSPTGQDLKRLRRLLIEDCFPDGLKQLPADWDSPGDWLGKQDDIPTVKKVRQIAPNVAAWLLIEAVCGHSEKGDNLLEGILPIVGNLDEKVAGNMTRREWFEELATLLRKGSTPDGYGEKFTECLVKHWGPLITETKNSSGTQRIVNPLTYSAYCAARLGLWFDPREDAFYQYQSEHGIWTFLMEVEVQRLLLEWVLEGMITEAKPTLKFVEQIIKHLKVIALYEKTDLTEIPVHLADEMLYLREDREPAPFSPAYFSKNRIPISYDYSKTARNALFEDFLKRSLEQDDIELLQKWCGYVLLGKNPHHKILLVRGIGGSGKSTLVDIFETIIGSENVASLNVERLDDRFELAAFRDKTLLIGKDVASNIFKSKAAHTLKALSGDQGIEAELKFENRRFKLHGPFNIVITSNADLEIGLRGDAVAWERRLLIIDFNKQVERDEKILNYAAVIIESSPEGILNWMLQGASKVLKMERLNEKLTFSVKQDERLQRLLNQSSSIDFFIKTCIEAAPGKVVTSRVLHENYLEFCNQQVLNPIDESLFYKRILAPLFRLYQAEASENVVANVHAADRARGYKQIAIKPKSQWPPPHKIQKGMVLTKKISEGDILNAEGMKSKLADKQNPASQWVLTSFAKVDQENILGSNRSEDAGQDASKKQKTIPLSLVDGLNKFIGEPIYYKKSLSAIEAVKLRPETKTLLDKKPEEVKADVRTLKRMILEDIFPDDLAKMPGSQAAKENGQKPAAADNTPDVPF